LKELRVFAALSGLLNTGRLLLCGGIVSLFLVFGMSQEAYATDPSSSEQVVVSPAQQAVNTALATATLEVQGAIDASNTATTVIQTANTEYQEASTAVSEISTAASTAESSVNQVTSLVSDLETQVSNSDNTLLQTSEEVTNVELAGETATTAVSTLNLEITQAQTSISEATSARTSAVTAVTAAQTELTQANIAIDNAQTAINNLQATIGTTTNVLAGVDDAGVRMNLPFSLLMGGTLYNNVFVGSNATITFGVDEGWVYYQTPNAPSVSIAGWDWTTWSTGTGITYSTTESTLDIAWDLRPFPQQDASTQMVQIRFNADVNPTDGAWRADVSAVGPIPNGARFNYRETTNGATTTITDLNNGTGFNGQIGQGPAFTPIVNTNISAVQSAIDAANATIFQLNTSLSPVVSNNASNQSALASVPTTNSLTSATNSYITVKNQLNESLNSALTNLDTVVNALPAQAKSVDQPNLTVVPDFDYSDITEPDTETPSEPTEEQPQEESPEESPVENEETPSEDEQPVEEEEQPESEEQEQESPLEESSPEPTTTEEAIEDALADGELTSEEREAIAEALLTEAAGEAISAETLEEAGLTYSDLPPETPVEVRTDENGNPVIIEAEVAAALQLFEDPGALISGALSCLLPVKTDEELTEEQKCQVLTALANIGADMSPQEREEAEKMVVAAIIASGAALNAVGVATTGSSPSSGGSSGGGGASGDSKGVRRRKP